MVTTVQCDWWAITSDIALIDPLVMICDGGNSTTGVGTSENRSWADPPPTAPYLGPDWNVGIDARHCIRGSVNYGHGVVSKKRRHDRSGSAPLRVQQAGRRRGDSKRQKCRRTTIRQPLANCEGSPTAG